MPATKAPWHLLPLLGLIFIVFVTLILYNPTYGRRVPTPPSLHLSPPNPPDSPSKTTSNHPIDQLIEAADLEFKTLLKKETKALNHAAQEYRRKRNRHPPPGFDQWYHYATTHNALLIEDFFDQIYHDIAPFWGLQPSELRRQAKGYRPRISVRNGMVSGTPSVDESRMGPWNAAIEEIKAFLPDIDIPLNMNDEPALIAPWRDIDDLVSGTRRFSIPVTEVVDAYSGLADVDAVQNLVFDPEWLTARRKRPDNMLGELPYWSLVKEACGPDTATARHEIWLDIWGRSGSRREHYADAIFPTDFPDGSLGGYVRNWTTAADPCAYPAVQGLYAGFVRPRYISSSTTLFPMFSGTKFGVNNDVLLPSPEDWNASISTDDDIAPLPWVEKEFVLFWRGPASGGENTNTTWRRFQRHRFVSMMDAAQVRVAEETLDIDIDDKEQHIKGVPPAKTFKLLPKNPYNLPHQSNSTLSTWLSTWSNISFTDMLCHPPSPDQNATTPCHYNSAFFANPVEPVPYKEWQKYKYHPILDGDAYPSNFLAALKSTSLPLRASLYKTWLDNRIIPWLHFVPMDNTFVDVYGIMAYFLDHDDAAERIAMEGHEWTKRVARKEDIVIYTWRLLLEFARVVDDRREGMGWVGDLVDGGQGEE